MIEQAIESERPTEPRACSYSNPETNGNWPAVIHLTDIGGIRLTDAPKSPHLVLPGVRARLYFGHAIEDRSMPKAALETWSAR
jgi:hypothetical protein